MAAMHDGVANGILHIRQGGVLPISICQQAAKAIKSICKLKIWRNRAVTFIFPIDRLIVCL